MDENDPDVKWTLDQLDLSNLPAIYGKFNVLSVSSINVLLFGRSCVGKTTIINTLINPLKAVKKNQTSTPANPTVVNLIVEDISDEASGEDCKSKDAQKPKWLRQKLTYQLNMIDTPGLQEYLSQADGLSARGDDEILGLAATFLEANITKLNVVALVMNVGNTIKQDIEMFQSVTKFLGDSFSEISVIILTHCDMYSNDFIDSAEKALKEKPLTAPIVQYCKLGILRFGAINQDTMMAIDDATLRRSILEKRLKLNQEFRQKFLKAIVTHAKTVVHLKNLNKIQERLKAESDSQFNEGRQKAFGEVKDMFWIKRLFNRFG